MHSWKSVNLISRSFLSFLNVRTVACGLLLLISCIAMSQPSAAKHFAVRLKPHEDLKKELMRFAAENALEAAAIVTCVGSLEKINLRFANQEKGFAQAGHFEIVSLTGTISASACHLHISVSDSSGRTTGGHLLDGNLVYTTAELVLVELTDLKFDRTTDSAYGYSELSVRKRRKND